jgi:hypothetical protein
MVVNKCVICDRPITIPFWVCRNCEKQWGLVGVDYRNWPEWIKALVIIEKRYRNYSRFLESITIENDVSEVVSSD